MPHRLILLLVAVMILVSEIAVGNTAQKDPRSVVSQRQRVEPTVWQEVQKIGTVRVLVQMNRADREGQA
jgi:ABC-type transport system involved in cytochrome bd biosynthesis fused ATPase/permease subunit